MFFGQGYLLYVLVPVMIAMYASSRVQSTYRKYSKYKNQNGYTGAQVAQMILNDADISHIRIEQVAGNLTDHYDSKNNVLRLSQGVYNSTSIAAIGIAAHECGHAIQDDENYLFLRIRHLMVPAVSFATNAATPLAFIGIFLGAASRVTGIGFYLLQLAVILFGVAFLFHLVTLPVELDASRRAIDILEGQGILIGDEIKPAKKVLNAAAFTYIAALLVALGNFMRFAGILRRRN